VAVASAGPYASLHLAPDKITTPAPHYSDCCLFCGVNSWHLWRRVVEHVCDCADEKMRSYLEGLADYRVILVTTQDDGARGFVCWLVCW